MNVKNVQFFYIMFVRNAIELTLIIMKERRMRSDSEIVSLFWQRDEEAIRETDRKYGHYCFSVAYHILFDNQDAQESVNDTWLKAWEKIPPERPRELKYYLVKITRYISLNRLRANTADKRGNGEYETALEELEGVLSESTSPEEYTNASVLKDEINRFLRTLKKDHRQIFIRRYFYLENAKQIADLYHMSENNVNVILNRIRKRLKDHLLKEGIL